MMNNWMSGHPMTAASTHAARDEQRVRREPRGLRRCFGERLPHGSMVDDLPSESPSASGVAAIRVIVCRSLLEFAYAPNLS